MSEIVNKKKSPKTTTTVLSVFVLLIILFGTAIYFLPEYYFIKPAQEFNFETSSLALEKKKKDLKQLNFDIFTEDKFLNLRKDVWYVGDEGKLLIGNSEPFKKAVE